MASIFDCPDLKLRRGRIRFDKECFDTLNPVFPILFGQVFTRCVVLFANQTPSVVEYEILSPELEPVAMYRVSPIYDVQVLKYESGGKETYGFKFMLREAQESMNSLQQAAEFQRQHNALKIENAEAARGTEPKE